MFNLDLSWKPFNVSCDSIKTWLLANVETANLDRILTVREI
jgi:hypothetical protein